MASANYIDVLIRMIDASKYQRDAEKSAKSTKDIGTAAETTGKQAGTSLRSLLKWAGTTTVFATAAHYLHGAVEESINLGVASMQLNRVTGLGIKVSSEWLIVAKQWGVEGNRLGVMFSSLGLAQKRALAGSKMQAAAFRQVGLSAQDLRTMNTSQIVEQIANAFQSMPNGLQKAALAQQLFGRTGRQLLPMLNQGGDALRENLDLVEKYGAALEGKTSKDILIMIKRHREMEIAQMGVKEQLADALIPTLTALSQNLRVLFVVLNPLLHNQIALRIVLGTLVIGWLAYTAATVAATLATVGFRTVLITTGVGALLVGLGIAILLVATHWDELTAAANRAWQWIKTNWDPLAIALSGPFVAMSIIVAKAVDLIISNINRVTGPIRSLVGAAESVGGFVGGALSGAADFVGGGPNVPTAAAPILLAGGGGGAGGGGSRVFGLQGDVHMDGAKVGKVIWKNADDRGARR